MFTRLINTALQLPVCDLRPALSGASSHGLMRQSIRLAIMPYIIKEVYEAIFPLDDHRTSTVTESEAR